MTVKVNFQHTGKETTPSITAANPSSAWTVIKDNMQSDHFPNSINVNIDLDNGGLPIF